MASEVCQVLGYANPRDAAKKHVRKHQKGSIAFREVSSNGLEQQRNKTIINEGGLNRLILRSRTLQAEKFQDWVTDEVPQVHKTGSFNNPSHTCRRRKCRRC